MAGIDTGHASTGKRDVNLDLPLVPFIDFLLCLVSFLLVTAVWTLSARLEADARVPGKEAGENPEPKAVELHVKVRPQRFVLEWREGETIVAQSDVPRKDVPVRGFPQYPDLAQAIEQQWRTHGTHRSPSDTKLDRAVVHTDNATSYGEIVAVMDAVHASRKAPTPGGDRSALPPAFNVAFVTN